MKIFSSARLRLTLWYIAALSSISLFFSFGIYKVETIELDRFEAAQRLRLEARLNNDLPLRGRFAPILIDEELIAETRKRLLLRLGFLNGVVVVFAGGLGYFLAGRTLSPIEKMVEEQHRFVSDASHELKTPLTAMRTSLEVFLRGKKPTMNSARTLIAENLTEVKRLQSLSESLLKLSFAERESTHFEPVDLSLAITSAIKRLAPIATDKKIKLTSKLVKGSVKGDPDQLQELFTILLDNAIKYTRPQTGKVKVTLSKSRRHLTVTIKDNGSGIAPTELPHIFDRFYRADSARNKKGESGGYGLGLAIAKKITTTHHASLFVDSKEHHGTTFVITFPAYS